MTTPKPLIVLLHGAWMGGFCWHNLVPALSTHGLTVLAPTLAGCGERFSEMTAEVSLHTHTQEIIGLLADNPQENIIIVGHSYGAAVASEVAGTIPDRIQSLVILDGFLAEAGKSILDSYPMLEDLFSPLVLPEAPAIMQVPPPSFVGMPEGIDYDWVSAHMRPMPVAVFREPCRFSVTNLACQRHYIRFTGFPAFADSSDRARQGGWSVTEIDGTHMAILTHAEKLAGLISP